MDAGSDAVVLGLGGATTRAGERGETHLREGGTASGVVDDVGDDTLNVPMTLGEILRGERARARASAARSEGAASRHRARAREKKTVDARRRAATRERVIRRDDVRAREARRERRDDHVRARERATKLARRASAGR
jgi:hypothetical protein